LFSTLNKSDNLQNEIIVYNFPFKYRSRVSEEPVTKLNVRIKLKLETAKGGLK